MLKGITDECLGASDGLFSGAGRRCEVGQITFGSYAVGLGEDGVRIGRRLEDRGRVSATGIWNPRGDRTRSAPRQHNKGREECRSLCREKAQLLSLRRLDVATAIAPAPTRAAAAATYGRVVAPVMASTAAAAFPVEGVLSSSSASATTVS